MLSLRTGIGVSLTLLVVALGFAAQPAPKNAPPKITNTLPVASPPPKISFTDDVVPTLARLGCSSGTCHGAAQGKGGFRLSLRGYAPELDYASITKQLGGRRITPTEPQASLFLRKPLLEIPHRGGKIFDKNQPEYKLLLGWIEQGALSSTGAESPLASVTLNVSDKTMAIGQKMPLRVTASYENKREENVTKRALFASNDPAVASVDENGNVTLLRSGETAIVVKYRDKVAAVRVVSPYAQKTNPAVFTAKSNNYIDTHVLTKLQQLNIEPSGRCTDQEFMRRAYIDTIGTLPTEAEARSFLESKSPTKRAELVDSLLTRPEFGMVWALKLGDLFVLRKEHMQRRNAMQFQAWLADQFNNNVAWDTLTTQILTATGPLETNPATLFWISRVPMKPEQGYWIRATENSTEMIAQVFLGNRIGCAKCHNHPTEKYTQDDYYRFVTLFHQTSSSGESDEGLPIVLEAKFPNEMKNPRTGKAMLGCGLDRIPMTFAKDEDRRVQAARWVVEQDDFARNIVNRLWARCFGQGIIEPVDDIRSTNPAKNEPLMRALCADLRAHKFDIKYLLKTILASDTYQRSSVATPTNKIDTKNFSRYYARRLPAEELADALAQVTGVGDKYQGLPYGARAIEVSDAEIPSIMLDTFGRPARIQCAEGERSVTPALGQALALLNSEVVQNKLKSGECVIHPQNRGKQTDAKVLDSLFLSTLARYPKPQEYVTLTKIIGESKNKDEAWQDVLWALLNSKEFLFNH
jgi:ribosomal protein L10